MLRSVNVQAPNRLHFGLISFGGVGRQFGGVGAMVENGLHLRIGPAEQFSVQGDQAGRVMEFAGRWQTFHGLKALPCAMTVVHSPPEHSGLGVGTQLGMSVAAGLSVFFGLPQQSPTELAVSVGRGQRSAVGTHGFALGGLIVERGKMQGELVSPLDCHVDLPGDWGVFLARPRGHAGLASQAEIQAFKQLPQVPQIVRDELVRIVRDELVPAAAQGSFLPFADAVYRYGRLSGECFAAVQGGPYNGRQLSTIVDLFRDHGLTGVGQSSWGPTIFAFTDSSGPAHLAREPLAMAFRQAGLVDVELTHVPVNNGGARITAMTTS